MVETRGRIGAGGKKQGQAVTSQLRRPRGRNGHEQAGTKLARSMQRVVESSKQAACLDLKKQNGQERWRSRVAVSVLAHEVFGIMGEVIVSSLVVQYSTVP